MKKNRKAFTLVELLVVIAILAILATVSILGYTSFTKKAKQSNAQSELNQTIELLMANTLDGKEHVIGYYIAAVTAPEATPAKFSDNAGTSKEGDYKITIQYSSDKDGKVYTLKAYAYDKTNNEFKKTCEDGDTVKGIYDGTNNLFDNIIKTWLSDAKDLKGTFTTEVTADTTNKCYKITKIKYTNQDKDASATWTVKDGTYTTQDLGLN